MNRSIRSFFRSSNIAHCLRTYKKCSQLPSSSNLSRSFPLGICLPTPCLHKLDLWNNFGSYRAALQHYHFESVGLECEEAKMVEEDSVGIKCNANSVPGFRGILKHRYADFLVNEVDCDGNVVHLKRMDVPDEVSTTLGFGETAGAEKASECKGPEAVNDLSFADHEEAFRGIVNDSDVQLLRSLLARVSEGEKDNLAPIILSPDPDKLHRTVVHNFFKTRLAFLVTDTVDGPDSFTKCVRVRYFDGKSGSGGWGRSGKRGRDCRGRWDRHKRQKYEGPEFDSRGMDDWPVHRGKYLQFHLFKENKDTQDALMVIGRMLGVQPKSFGIAGTKDKRAVTTQKVTAFKQVAGRVAALNKRLYGIKVGDFCYVNEGLVLGKLSGNRFTIALRGVVAENDNAIKEAAEGLKNSGFINYFGLQRFGTGLVPTHTVGAALLRGEWETAVNLILRPRDGERNEVSEAREYYMKTKDADGTLLRMPRQLVTERAVLIGLRKNPGNFLQAINNIPRTMRMMFVHSYQSYLWNHAASKRIQEYGIDKVIKGDLVYCSDVEVENSKSDGNEPLDNINGIEDVVDGLENLEDVVDDNVMATEVHQVKLVTDEDLACGKFTMYDVVLPLPGFRTLLPGNNIADVYNELASQDLLDLKSCLHKVKEFSFLHLSGGYRRVLQVPMDFEWKILKYDDMNEPLVETDLERIVGCNKENKVEPQGDKMDEKQAVLGVQSDPGAQPEISTKAIVATAPAACHTAVLLNFTLPASCYATMAIRELLKIPTSVAFHKSLKDDPST